MRKRTLTLLGLVVVLLAPATAEAHHFPKPADYPFAGDLPKRERWQERTLEHASEHLRRLDYQGPVRILEDGSKEATAPALARTRHWIGIVRHELRETRAALAAAAAAVAPAVSSGGGVSYLCGLQIDPRWTDGTWASYGNACGSTAEQIAVAEKIAAASEGDPWPHCDDPYDGSGASWEETNACENSGNW